MYDKADTELDTLRIKSLCAGLETYWEPPETMHWISLHRAAEKARGTVSQAYAAIDKISADKDLSSEGKKRQKHERATAMLVQVDDLIQHVEKARTAAAKQIAKWYEPVTAHVKAAETEAEAMLHAEIRRHVASLNERERLSFFQKHGAEQSVAGAILEAPPFLSGVGNAELAMVKASVEKRCLAPEIVEMKGKVERALAELERAPRAARSMIMARAGLDATLPSLPENKPAPAFKAATAAVKTNPPSKAPAWIEA